MIFYYKEVLIMWIWLVCGFIFGSLFGALVCAVLTVGDTEDDNDAK